MSPFHLDLKSFSIVTLVHIFSQVLAPSSKRKWVSIGMKHLALHPYHLKKILTFSRVVRSIMSELQTTDTIKMYETEQVCHPRRCVDILHSTSPVLQSVCSKYLDSDLYNSSISSSSPSKFPNSMSCSSSSSLTFSLILVDSGSSP